MENKNIAINLMGGRLGVFDRKVQLRIEGDGIADEVSDGIVGLHNQKRILNYYGGTTQQVRMIKDKRRSLDRALLYSYQAASIEKVSGEKNTDNGFTPIGVDEKENKIIKALINPNKLKLDYDDKIISVPSEAGLTTGDIFEWKGTDTKWIIYLQDLTELAYFRGDIRKCSYVLRWLNAENKICESYCAVRGPVETKINYIQKNGISVDEPNHSLNIYMPKNKETVAYFKRYSKFYLTRCDEDNDFRCWRVEATDDISTPGILEVTAVEYYANDDADDLINGIVGGNIPEKEAINKPNVEILLDGETFIKPKKEYVYKYKGLNNSVWSIDKKYPVKWSTNPEDTSELTLKWNSNYSGQFEITYGNFTKTIVVESLF